MNKLMERLIEILRENRFKVVEKNNVVTFLVCNEGRFKFFFHESTVDLAFTYKSSLTKSGTRNLVIKDIKSAEELLTEIENIITGVELSNSVLNSTKSIEESLSYDTYNRYSGMKELNEIVEKLFHTEDFI